MENLKLEEFIKSIDNELDIKQGKQFPEISIPASKLLNIARELKENKETDFDFLFCLTGVDYGSELGVVYHLRSTRLGHTIVLKVKTPDRENPEFQSVTDVWKTAEYHEREVYDLLGIKFTGHPDLRRFFLDNSWGFPLRKDYVDDISIVTK
jgi:NADH-quinone oxidoreductase subunit C